MLPFRSPREAAVLILAIVTIWVALGAAAAALMRHRGHDWFGWGLLFVVLGPLAIPLAVSADRHRPSEPARPLPPGGLDVLACDDGSSDARAALDAALSLLGTGMTSLTLAAVLDFEAPTTARGHDAQRDAQQRLETLAQEVAGSTKAPVATVILFGDPADALQHFALEQGYEVIVAGSRVAERSHLGSHRVARRLKVERSVPILIGPVTP